MISRPEYSNQQTFVKRLLSRFLSFFFRLLYNEFAWSYDLVADIVSLGKWKSWIYCVLPYLDKPHILELGYGPGHLQSVLRQNTESTFGIDSSVTMARQAVKRLKQRGHPSHLIIGKTQYLPFPNDSFNFVVSTFPSDYIFDPLTLKEIWRVLNSSGELIVLAFAWITGDRWSERFMAWLFRWTNQSPDFSISTIQGHYFSKSAADSVNDFQFTSEVINQNSSKLLILRARKRKHSEN